MSSSSSDEDIVFEERSSTYEESTGKSSGETAEQREKFTQKESRNVFLLRVLVIAVIFLAALAVSFVVYYISRNGEEDDFETNYDGTAQKVLDTFASIPLEKFQAMTALSVATTAHSVDHFRRWPFVTLSSFQKRSEEVKKQSGAIFVSVVPRVTLEDRDEWEAYSEEDEDNWIPEGITDQVEWDAELLGVTLPLTPESVHPGYIIRGESDSSKEIREDGSGPYYPFWETSPLIEGLVNFNLASIPDWMTDIDRCVQNRGVVLSRKQQPPSGDALQGDFLTRLFASLLSIDAGHSVDYEGLPISFVYLPVFDSWNVNDRGVAAVLFAMINWASFFQGILPENIEAIDFILENECDEPHTFTVHGPLVDFKGVGDLHDNDFDSYERKLTFADLVNASDTAYPLASSECPYAIRVYPSQQFYDSYVTNSPISITLIVGGIFIFTAIMFVLYDRLVERRQQLLLRKATQSSAILASLFPKTIRDQLMAEAEENHTKDKGDGFRAPNHRLKSFLSNDGDAVDDKSQKPIADLFPHCSVLFADISGFTAWSSTRDPSHVFILLQTLYQAFDQLAKTRRVFKVETIGDSYAVTGCPEAQANHAVIMARFAADCMVKMKQISKELTVTLGPDTADLSMRFGIHSGPVTAGVLRGERSRFQLFGDTVNTAARMESTGVPGKIQISESTANLLTNAGKAHWHNKRADAVEAKGKGVLNTYWLTVTAKKAASASSSKKSTSSTTEEDALLDTTTHKASIENPETRKSIIEENLVDWIVELLQDHIKQILAQRQAKKGKLCSLSDKEDFFMAQHCSNMEEVVEVISLPSFDEKGELPAAQHTGIEIEPVVKEQLRHYVLAIASMYQKNAFHNFQHACHVVMVVNKFLQRIVAPDIDMNELKNQGKSSAEDNYASQVHVYTHGITSDPLTLFAVVFAALVHDADHRGCSNAQLAKEEQAMASLYNNKSIAEQNSLDLAWEMFMFDDFTELRKCLFDDREAFLRFRQIVVNLVLATDIFDKELNDLRRDRWNRAFSEGGELIEKSFNGLRATIVLEHIIQAADVSHTMQHWHVYRKWNGRLFEEMTDAYLSGRMGADPATFWYKGELGFFDNYVIPLANKLKECNVFGVSSDEALNYALQNRREWEHRGQAVVEEMMSAYTSSRQKVQTG